MLWMMLLRFTIFDLKCDVFRTFEQDTDVSANRVSWIEIETGRTTNASRRISGIARGEEREKRGPYSV